MPLYELFTGWQQHRLQRQRLLSSAAAAATQQQQTTAQPKAKVLRVGAPPPAAPPAASAAAAVPLQARPQMRPIDLFYSRLRVSGLAYPCWADAC